MNSTETIMIRINWPLTWAVIILAALIYVLYSVPSLALGA